MEQSYESKILDHLGLVAGMCDELEIQQQIDERIVQDFEQREVSIGQAVKAMILNGLGFVNQRLYLVPFFFETKPTERLLGEGVHPEHLNDDTLGRALDALHAYGVTELFRDLAAHAAEHLDLAPRFAHLDATSFHVDGQYNSQEEEPEARVIHIRKGYSRDHRPELNQVVLDLVVEHEAGLPILMKPLSGNTSDQSSFPELIERHLSHLQMAHGFDYVVADCALYAADHIAKLSARGTRFITRVPATISEAQAVMASTRREDMEPLAEGYSALVHESTYGGAEQRWLIIHSDAAEARARKRIPKQRERMRQAEAKALRALMKQEFACREDAEQTLQSFEEGLQISRLTRGRVLECTFWGTLSGGRVPAHAQETSYIIEGALGENPDREEVDPWREALFILATNELDEQVLPNEDVLTGYKGQSSVERGFRFLKDPLFLASSFYVQKEERIMALLMVMTLCLMVYAALEWRIRRRLCEQEAAIPDQKGRPTQRPTARWVFQSFVGIHLLIIERQRLVLNMREHHQIIVAVLGRRYERFYASGPT